MSKEPSRKPRPVPNPGYVKPWLPVPSQEAIERFRVLAREEFGLELDEAQAGDYATRLLQLHWILAYARRRIDPRLDELAELMKSKRKKPS